MDNLKQEIEQWEQEANPVTEEIINEMCEYYEKEEDEKKVEIKEIPVNWDWGELKYLGYDY